MSVVITKIQNNQTTVSLLKTITKVLPVHSETDIPKDLAHIVAGISRLIKENYYKLAFLDGLNFFVESQNIYYLCIMLWYTC